MRGLAAGYAVTKAELAALVAFASEDFTRAHIHGVQFTRTGDRAVGVTTDGHTLVRVQGLVDTAAIEADVFVPMAVAKATLKSIGKGVAVFGTEARIFPTADPSSPAATEAMVAGTTLPIPPKGDRDMPFPPYAQVIPPLVEGKPGGAVAFNADYYARVALVAKACVAGRKTAVAVQQPTLCPLDPIRFDASSTEFATEWTAVVMPMRHFAERDTETARKDAFWKWLDEDACARDPRRKVTS